MLVAGAVEIEGGKPRRARLNVIEGFGKHELHTFVLGAVAPQTQLVTDDWPSYQNLPGVRHNAITLGPMAAHIALPWIHRLFSNLKRWGLGVYHGLRKPNLQHTLMSSSSASTGAGHAMLPSTPCSASAPAPRQFPIVC